MIGGWHFFRIGRWHFSIIGGCLRPLEARMVSQQKDQTRMRNVELSVPHSPEKAVSVTVHRESFYNIYKSGGFKKFPGRCPLWHQEEHIPQFYWNTMQRQMESPKLRSTRISLK